MSLQDLPGGMLGNDDVRSSNPTETLNSTKPVSIKKIALYQHFFDVLTLSVYRQELGGHKFRVIKDKKGKKIFLEETEAEIVFAIDIEKVADALNYYFDRHFLKDKTVKSFTIKDFENGARWWASLAPSLERKDIALFKQKSEKGLTWHKFPWDLTSGATPIFDEMMSRVSNSERLMAYIGSGFDSASDRQQYAWLYGEGKNGKGALLRVIKKAWGNLAKNELPLVGNQFWTSGFEFSRWVLFDDCDNALFITKGLFKSLTGGSEVRVENKGKDSRDAELMCKIIIASNDRPSLTGKTADVRRAIYCEFLPIPSDQEFAGDYEAALWAEAPHFFFKCWQKYQMLQINGGKIPIDRESLDEIVSSQNETYRTIFETTFAPVDKAERDKAYVDPIYLISMLKYSGFSRSSQVKDFKQWMETEMGVKRKQIPISPGKREWVYYGIRPLSDSEQRDALIRAYGMTLGKAKYNQRQISAMPVESWG